MRALAAGVSKNSLVKSRENCAFTNMTEAASASTAAKIHLRFICPPKEPVASRSISPTCRRKRNRAPAAAAILPGLIVVIARSEEYTLSKPVGLADVGGGQ